MSRKTGAPTVTLEDLLPSLFLKDWHFLITTSTVVADIIAIADAVEADKSRQFVARTSNKEDLATIKAKGYKRTFGTYHKTIENYPDAAWVGAVGSLPVGSVTWKGWTLVGIEPMDIDATELNAIHALGANTYLTRAGTNVTSEGSRSAVITLILFTARITSCFPFSMQCKTYLTRRKLRLRRFHMITAESLKLRVQYALFFSGLFFKE